MSGPSRKEIVDLLGMWREALAHNYPGYNPTDVCKVYADIEAKLAKSTGSPDLHLRELGRMLKRHLDTVCRGHANHAHNVLLATWYPYVNGDLNLQAAQKRARREIGIAENNPKHWLHTQLPQFKGNAGLELRFRQIRDQPVPVVERIS